MNREFWGGAGFFMAAFLLACLFIWMVGPGGCLGDAKNRIDERWKARDRENP